MDAAAFFYCLLIAFLAVLVFAGVFAALYLAAVTAPVKGPGWLVWPILAFMLSASSLAAYTIVLEPALEDDPTECADENRESSMPCVNAPVS